MSRDTSFGRWLLAAACVPVVLSLAAWSMDAVGQDAKKPEDKPAAKKEGAKKEPKGRLPNNFSKVGIDDQQKEKIYAIQSKYDDQLSKLEGELKALRSQRDAEVEGVLTADQKAKLKKLADEAKAEQAAKKKAADDKKAAEKKDAPKEAPKEAPKKAA